MKSRRCLDRRGCVQQERAEHGLVVVAVVPLPDPFVQVAGKPTGRDRVMGAAHVGLEVAEEALDGVRVYVALDVDALRVADAAELVDACAVEDVVAAPRSRTGGAPERTRSTSPCEAPPQKKRNISSRRLSRRQPSFALDHSAS